MSPLYFGRQLPFVASKVAMDNEVYTLNNLNLRGTTKQRVVEIIDTEIKIMQYKIQYINKIQNTNIF